MGGTYRSNLLHQRVALAYRSNQPHQHVAPPDHPASLLLHHTTNHPEPNPLQYKQATKGDNTRDRPSIFDQVGRAK